MPSKIAPYLYQNSKPIEGDALARSGVRVLVLCAEEYQPPTSYFPGLLDVIYAPNDDSGRPFTPTQQIIAKMAAFRVADYVRRKQTVLVTCYQGRNRSGLVSALAIHYLTGMHGKDCVDLVRRKRKDALTNDDFVRFLRSIAPRRFARAG
jgi:protein-tyrosine phosphatase